DRDGGRDIDALPLERDKEEQEWEIVGEQLHKPAIIPRRQTAPHPLPTPRCMLQTFGTGRSAEISSGGSGTAAPASPSNGVSTLCAARPRSVSHRASSSR